MDAIQTTCLRLLPKSGSAESRTRYLLIRESNARTTRKKVVSIIFVLLKLQIFRTHDELISEFLPFVSVINAKRRHTVMVLRATRLRPSL